MSEHADLPPAEAGAPVPVRTGVLRVDEVLSTVDGLEDRPLEDHVGVFESAHDQLRRALDADPDAVPDDPA